MVLPVVFRAKMVVLVPPFAGGGRLRELRAGWRLRTLGQSVSADSEEMFPDVPQSTSCFRAEVWRSLVWSVGILNGLEDGTL